MKKLAILFLFLFNFSLYSQQLQGTVKSFKGKTMISSDNVVWSDITKETIVKESDIVQTGFNSSLEFIIDDVDIKIGSLSRVTVKKAFLTSKNLSARFELDYGTVKAKVNKTHNEKNHVAVDAKSAGITAVAVGTEYSVNALGNVSVFNGVVRVYNTYDFDSLDKSDSNKYKEVKAGQHLFRSILGPDFNIKQPVVNQEVKFDTLKNFTLIKNHSLEPKPFSDKHPVKDNEPPKGDMGRQPLALDDPKEKYGK